MDLISAQKAALRQTLRRARAQRSHHDIAQCSANLRQALIQHIPADAALAAYLPMTGEPDLLPFLREHISRGGRVFIPLIPHQGRIMQWAPWTPETPLRRHPVLPVEEPAPDSAQLLHLADLTQEAEVTASGGLRVLTPALAVDTTGSRIGQGGGYYDTTLAHLQDTLQKTPSHAVELIAVVYAEEVLRPGRFPVEDHDIRVAQVATEQGIVDLSA